MKTTPCIHGIPIHEECLACYTRDVFRIIAINMIQAPVIDPPSWAHVDSMIDAAAKRELSPT